ncbi:MAG: response regulator transcription factor [Ignavibacteriales bacterium]|nr:response regulator transcription factor [Ignavibacteriales bacterium]
MKILVIEDEKKVSAFIRKGLEEDGYETDAAYDGDEGAAKAAAGSFDLMVLDIQMPKKDGLTLLTELRDAGVAIPVLMLTARSAVEDRVKGLDTGADDYLVKPFAVDELLARVRSLLRRGTTEKTTVLSVADMTLDLVHHNAVRAASRIELTAKEYLLLEYFMRNKNKVLSRSMISQHIWNYNFDTGTNIIDVYISHLRTKIDGGAVKKLIHTVRGVGYVLKEK